MSDITLRLRYTLGWIYLPKRRPVRQSFSVNDVTLLCRYTRQWIHYGLFAHIVICTVIGAVEGVFGR